MKLVIVESPNKVKKISAFLGNGYRVGASFGHIRDLPEKGGLGVVFKDGHIDPHYIVTKKDTASRLQQLARGAEEILIATDPDREGEAIGWHVMQLLGADNYSYKRVTFNQITRKAVLDAVAKPGEMNLNLVNAQQARRVFDRVVGWVVSPTLRCGVGKKEARSAGRVQSTALRLVVERELAIQAFDNRDYFEIDTQLLGSKPPAFVATLSEWEGKKLEHRLQSEEEAEALLERCRPGAWMLDSVDRKQTRRHAPPPFTTSTVQQAASIKLKMAPDQTMKALQALFEAGHITYHRTDSVALSPEAIDAARSIIKNEYGSDYVPGKANQHKSKVANAQEAHEAIRPTHPEHGAANPAVKDFQNVYQLIWERYIASQMAAGVDDVTVYGIKTESEPAARFRARGSVCVFDGWRLIGDDSTSEKKNRHQDAEPLPQLAAGETLTLKQLKLNKKTTKPPARYTQASLIKEMEKRGIGRPSTYAGIMKTIMARTYVSEKQRKLHASELGISVCQWLMQHYQGNFIEIAYTSGMEERLDAMSRGELDWESAITEESERLVAVSQKAGLNYNPLSGDGPPAPVAVDGVTCPECKGAMRAIQGAHGEFYGCMKYPECKGTRSGEKQAKEQAEAEKKAPLCPLCESNMRYRKSAHGAFWGCSQFPKCKGLRNSDGEDKSPSQDAPGKSNKTSATKNKTATNPDMRCPICNKPMRLVPEKPGRYQAFWGCNAYPGCKGTRQASDGSEAADNKKKYTKKDTAARGASRKKSGTSTAEINSCPECGSEMFRVPAQNGKPEHYTCRYAPDCKGIVFKE